MRAVILPIASVLCLMGCHREDSDSVKALRWIESANPIADANAAIAKGDLRLKGIYGYALTAPGIDRSKEEEYQSRFGVDPIKGTSDAWEGAEHARLIHLATAYAEAYNRRILSSQSPVPSPAK